MYEERLVAEKVVESVKRDNGTWVKENREVLEQAQTALRFSGYAFLALAVCQLVLESSIMSSLDEFAFGIFLIDAAHKIKLLLANASTKPAADELCSAVQSIADTHSIFAWVTSYQVGMLVFGFFGVQPFAQNHLYHIYDDFASTHVYLTHFVKAAAALLTLRYGGLDYARRKITYWTRASELATSLFTDKLARLLGRKRPLTSSRMLPKDTAKQY